MKIKRLTCCGINADLLNVKMTGVNENFSSMPLKAVRAGTQSSLYFQYLLLKTMKLFVLGATELYNCVRKPEALS